MAVIQNLCKEIAGKIREEKLYPENIIKTVDGLKSSEEFVKFISETFSKFARKCNQDVFLARFFGEIYKNWKKLIFVQLYDVNKFFQLYCASVALCVLFSVHIHKIS